MEWAYEFAAGAVFIALLLRSRFVDRFREVTMTTPPRFYLGLTVYMLGPLALYTCIASLIYRQVGFTFEDGLDRVLFSPIWISLLTVLIFTGLLQVQGVEARIRRISHRVAGIPDLATELRNSLRSAPFTISPEISSAVRLNLLRRGIVLEDIADARHSVLQSQLVSTTALLETIDEWAAEPGCRRFARAVEAERLRLREVVDRIAFRITSTNRGLQNVSSVLAQHKPMKEASGSLWDTLNESAEQSIYTGESDLMTEVMKSTRFVYDDLREDLRKVHDEACLLIAQGILRYQYTNQQRRHRIEQLGFGSFDLPLAPMGVLFYAFMILLVGGFAASVLTSSTTGLMSEMLSKTKDDAVEAKKNFESGAIGYAKIVSSLFSNSASNENSTGVADDATIENKAKIMMVQAEVVDHLGQNEKTANLIHDQLRERIGWSPQAMQNAMRVMMIAIIQLVALLCAILPKYHFTWANESLEGKRPMVFIVGAGIAAGILSIAIGLPFRALIEGSWEAALTFYKTEYPFALMAVATATCIAWLIQDRTWRNVSSSLQRRLRDGGCLLGSWIVAILIIRLVHESQHPWFAFLPVALVGFALGFIVPSTFRRTRKGRSSR